MGRYKPDTRFRPVLYLRQLGTLDPALFEQLMDTLASEFVLLGELAHGEHGSIYSC